MTTQTLSKTSQDKTVEKTESKITTAPAAVAMISGGIGTLFVGLMTTGAVLSESLSNFLNWWNPAGPLTGKTGVGILAWLVSWFLLNTIWKGKDYDLKKAFTITLTLIVLGLLLTFPPIFEAFE
ncbi:MAG TPA: hypothetical protein VI451_03370 [Anaerolineales bacterium]|nr:hypothetical protein [Anaerolineales bacterium]